MRRALVTKKLLVASIGVASVSYVACTKEPPPQVGNLMPPQATDASDVAPTATVPPAATHRTLVGNLMPMPMPTPDAGPPNKP